jgi:hypothetical protein
LVTLSGPTVLTLVNEADSGDVRQVSVELGGSGDEWTRQWDLSVSLDAAGAPDLIGGTVQAEISLQDRSGTGKRILTATPPAGYQTTQLSLAQAQFSGTMAALQSFMLGANEVQALLGFNDDGVLDATDIDLLYDAIAGGSSDLLYDLNNDALVDQTDVNVLIEVILETSFGDANLDQRVDDDDVLILRQNFGSQTGWAGGNFGPGNVVDANDFATLRSNYGFNAAAPAPATPEPTSLVLVGLAGLAALKKWRVEGGE